MEFLDPQLHSADKLYAQFEEYKKKREEAHLEMKNKVNTMFNLKADIKELNENMETLRVGMQQLDDQQKVQLHQGKLMSQSMFGTIEAAPPDEGQVPLKDDDTIPNKLLIKCEVKNCLFESCQRRIDSQLLLLHYLCDHENKEASLQRFLPVGKHERAVLSFKPTSCKNPDNQVLGLLAYNAQQLLISQRQCEPYNRFLLNQHSHLEGHIPVVVLISQTYPKSALRDRRSPDSPVAKSEFVLWLVTPSDGLQLNVTLSLYGRDVALKTSCVLGVRKVNNNWDADYYMAVDESYWRLTYAEVDKLSNNFRDELHLEVLVTEAEGNV
ncbi:uncharacterized protein LOC6608427 [Drosophila sechellia]|uniref:GM21164 n=1 Tax=Drosophila sechellia TaxID=7238 RepID=B4HM97_DROSE|nr:uncharacterized protein LOC6608427 [Drosophila sechellia]EDW47174.1 GM21164 [Drosophila sechellia]